MRVPIFSHGGHKPRFGLVAGLYVARPPPAAATVGLGKRCMPGPDGVLCLLLVPSGSNLGGPG